MRVGLFVVLCRRYQVFGLVAGETLIGPHKLRGIGFTVTARAGDAAQEMAVAQGKGIGKFRVILAVTSKALFEVQFLRIHMADGHFAVGPVAGGALTTGSYL
jgi:hypothetical protein